MSYPLRIAAWALLAMCLALGGWHAWRFAVHTAAGLDFAYPLDGLEGTLLYEARLLRAGEPLYQPLQPDRFVSAPYQPLSYVALAAAEQLAYRGGSPPRDVREGPIFRPGRAVSLLAIVGAGLLMALAAWRWSGAFWSAPLLLALWLGFAPAQLWATRIKPDPLALLFTAAGVLCVALASQPRSHAAAQSRSHAATLVFGAICFVLAFYTKQTAVAAPLAVGSCLLIGWRWRALLLFSGSYLGLLGLAWLGLQLLTAGQHGAHVFGLHSPDWWSFGLFRKYAGLMLESTWPLMLALVVALGAWAISLRHLPPTAPDATALGAFPLCYALATLPLLLLAGAEGAHHNHLLEPYLALCLAASGQIAARGRQLATRSSVIAVCLIVIQLCILTQRPAWYGGEFDLQRQERSQFVALIASQPGEVLADDVALLLAAGRDLRYDDPSTMGPAARIGLWDERNLLGEVAAQRFSLILLPFDATKTDQDPAGRWSPNFIATLREHYTILYRDVIFSYVPK